MKTFDLIGTLKFDLKSLSASMHIKQEDVMEIFTSGSGTHKVYQYALAKLLRMEPVIGTFSLYDGVESCRFNVRMMHQKGVSFSKSISLGGCRSFKDDAFYSSLDDTDGFFIIDTQTFPKCSVYFVSNVDVKIWYMDGILTRNAFMNRDIFYSFTQEYRKAA